MDNPIVADDKLITVLKQAVIESLGTFQPSPWMTQKEASAYVHMNYKTFKRLADQGVFKAHSGAKYGIAFERYNRDELDLAVKGL